MTSGHEPLLVDNPDRFCMFPIKYQEVWEMYKKAEASFWTGVPPAEAARHVCQSSVVSILVCTNQEPVAFGGGQFR